MKQYKTLDVFKFIAAFMIIVLHTAPFGSYSKIITYGFRHILTIFAVPFFFACSGFITFSKIATMDDKSEKNRYVAKYLKRIATMYLIWSAIYFVFVAYKWTLKPFSFLNVLEYIKDFFFEGSYLTIWFLPALFSATAIVYLLSQKFDYRKIVFISIPFYCFALLGSSYWGITQRVGFLQSIFNGYYSFFDTIKNGLLFGFIFVAIGAWVASNQEKLKISPKICLALIIGFGILMSFEAVLLNYLGLNKRGCDTIIMLIPVTICILLLALNWEVGFSDKLCLMCRKYSVLMFLVQRIPLSVIDLFMGDTIIASNSLLYFSAVLIATMALSFLIIKLSERIKFFKYMY